MKYVLDEGSEPARPPFFFMTLFARPPQSARAPLLLIRAIEISLSTRQAVYDCIYLALAESEGCEMVSADDQFVRKLRPAFPLLIRLADLP